MIILQKSYFASAKTPVPYTREVYERLRKYLTAKRWGTQSQ
jgi:hypothetical protein